jgi:serine/threonine protein phosphatase PrpC
MKAPVEVVEVSGSAGHLEWAGRAGRVRALSVWTERRPGRGEDAEPLALHHAASGAGLVAVFDGSGGSGAAPAWPGPDGETYSGAWVGARAARLGTERWFQRAVEQGEPQTPDRLAEHLRSTLRAANPPGRSKITGSMRRALPTTLAAVAYQLGDHDVRWRALWAGDSRSYVLLPGSGLHALSRDHTAEDDALGQLRQDPPMTNVVCADRPFTVDAQPEREYGRFPLPCVLLTATDGFFGYLHTPALFECLLLHTLAQSHGMADWAARLRNAVQGYTADDASLSLVALGFDDFPRFAEVFRDRYRQVTETYVNTFPGRYGPEGPEGPAGLDPLRRWQDETWGTYRTGYERYMPPLPDLRPDLRPDPRSDLRPDPRPRPDVRPGPRPGARPDPRPELPPSARPTAPSDARPSALPDRPPAAPPDRSPNAPSGRPGVRG